MHKTDEWNKNAPGELNKHLVEDVSLAAQVQVRQDAGRSHVGHRQTRLRDTGGNQSGLSFTQTRKQVRELTETTWQEANNSFHPDQWR